MAVREIDPILEELPDLEKKLLDEEVTDLHAYAAEHPEAGH